MEKASGPNRLTVFVDMMRSAWPELVAKYFDASMAAAKSAHQKEVSQCYCSCCCCYVDAPPSPQLTGSLLQIAMVEANIQSCQDALRKEEERFGVRGFARSLLVVEIHVQ